MKKVSLTDQALDLLEHQLWLKGAMDALIEAFKFFYKMDERPIRCTILAITEDFSKTRRGRLKLKGTEVVPAIIIEFDRRHREGRIVSDCDLAQFLPKPKGDDSMVIIKP